MKPPPVEACPRCGSVRRDGTARAGVAQATGAALSPESRAREPDPRYKDGRLRLSKSARESRVGMSVTRVDGIERSRRRTYDRVKHNYEETILNPDGSVYYHNAEDLRQHRRDPAMIRARRAPAD